MRKTGMGVMSLCLVLSLVGCASAKQTNPPLDQGVVVDGPPPGSDLRSDGPPTSDGPVSSDGPPTGDGPVLPDRKEGEIVSGGQVSTGGGYTLRSQVGHAVRPQTSTGGGYTLRQNAAVIPK